MLVYELKTCIVKSIMTQLTSISWETALSQLEDKKNI